MNYTEVGLDLQSLVKRIYQNLIYRSSFYKMLNDGYIGELRTAGTPMIEVIKSKDAEINIRETKEIQTALTPALAGYDNVKVDLTELPMDYSIRIPVLVAGTNIVNALESAIEKKDSAVALAIDTYGFGKLADGVENEFAWAPASSEDYVSLINGLKATLFNKNVYETYRLALSATEYGNLVSALTTLLKFETMTGREGVDRGIVANAYGVEIFPVNDNVIGDVKGYFFNQIAVVGDTFFDAFVQHNSPQGWPGYLVIEGNMLFGAEIVEQDAIIKLVETVSA